MPANPKYLTQSKWQKFAKLSAGILGGYLISALLHMVFILLLPFHKEALVSSTFSLFIVWVVLLIIPYLFKNGWKVWGLYVVAILFLSVLFYFVNQQNPFVQ